MRLIDADGLKKEIHRYALDVYGINLENSKEFAGDSKAEDYCEGLYEATELIDNAPTIDAEPVRHGRWEMKPDPYGFFEEIPVCSVCGCMTKWREKYIFCPNCGAKMDEVSE